ncbi:protein bunched, class 2/F/G isoform isoform X2 [Drosophila pseudoobscura]|uniref:Protein bunched, class 2/F/G isoform isoform X2 n=1 Tax=Drosophila pseudoobscura pseudoobscura TaxID=46245 RepID=A0A6I8W5S4_DROPS|nr:protein bunched, class 2/F/G isoform isoform X2 [Drosophila pseudoobscura]
MRNLRCHAGHASVDTAELALSALWPSNPVSVWLRPSSLRKSSSSSSSSINNACPPPPPTPHQVNTSSSSSSTPHQTQTSPHSQHQHPHPHHPHPHPHQHQHRRSSSSSHTSHAENTSSLATKPAINLLGNQLQVNYFEFPPATRPPASDQPLWVSRGRNTASTPALNSNSSNSYSNIHYSSAVAKAAASTACALLATCHVSRDSPQHQQYHHQQHQQHQQEEPQTPSSMGRREIKRSNTSGSTTRSYDSGSATTNFVGKFTQSVRRIVQDVKDEGAPSGMTRDEVIETNERLRSLRLRLEESYETAKQALINLMNKYGDSKSQRNMFQRYPMLKLMIKEVIRLETQYWTLVDIPRQEKQETVPSYVMRACSIMEKTQKSGEGVKTSAKLADEAAERRERMERLEHMTTAQIEHENTQLINDLYRLLKKYLGLRHLIRVLKEEYGSSKMYPIFPRYTMLKDMIKGIMHDPDYMEVCHETLANAN